MVLVLFLVRNQLREKVVIKGKGFKVVIEYGNIFEMDKFKKVIPFDECFTTEIGRAPCQIKPSSLCGKFLNRFPNVDIPNLISVNGIESRNKSSRFKNTKCFKSGTLLPFNDYLLMAFGKLDRDGRALMTREEYLDSLSYLWKEIHKYDSGEDVAIPIIGSGITGFKDGNLSQQELLDIILLSYQINPFKIKLPCTLQIVCIAKEDFSLSKIGNSFPKLNF